VLVTKTDLWIRPALFFRPLFISPVCGMERRIRREDVRVLSIGDAAFERKKMVWLPVEGKGPWPVLFKLRLRGGKHPVHLLQRGDMAAGRNAGSWEILQDTGSGGDEAPCPAQSFRKR
jgi:hypothetical protein